ncbi:hypothetical protein C8R47DRAFT_1081358 [Mycena vitilis]|nr:hypothetical protein C8R47DRAFT_1081358 [Mycena vitilis]
MERHTRGVGPTEQASEQKRTRCAARSTSREAVDLSSLEKVERWPAQLLTGACGSQRTDLQNGPDQDRNVSRALDSGPARRGKVDVDGGGGGGGQCVEVETDDGLDQPQAQLIRAPRSDAEESGEARTLGAPYKGPYEATRRQKGKHVQDSISTSSIAPPPFPIHKAGVSDSFSYLVWPPLSQRRCAAARDFLDESPAEYEDRILESRDILLIHLDLAAPPELLRGWAPRVCFPKRRKDAKERKRWVFPSVECFERRRSGIVRRSACSVGNNASARDPPLLPSGVPSTRRLET